MHRQTSLEGLQDWYVAQCDGEWEHEHGIRIDTLDNPGWSVVVDLAGTPMAGRSVEVSRVDLTSSDWLRWWVADDKWCAACGPLNLAEAVDTF